MNGDSNPSQQKNLTANTYVSFGLLLTLLGGFAAVLSTLYGAKSELAANQTRFEMKLDNVTARVDKMDASKESWGFQDMFKWAVHLQRDNPTIKVPDPDSK